MLDGSGFFFFGTDSLDEELDEDEDCGFLDEGGGIDDGEGNNGGFIDGM